MVSVVNTWQSRTTEMGVPLSVENQSGTKRNFDSMYLSQPESMAKAKTGGDTTLKFRQYSPPLHWKVFEPGLFSNHQPTK